MEKRPSLDSFIIPQGDPIELTVEYPGPGPVGAKILVDDELDGATSLPPSKTDFTIEFPAEDTGQYSIELIIEGAASGELQKLAEGNLTQPEEEVRVHAEWDITVANVDHLYQTNAEKLMQMGKDVLALYSAGVIGFEVLERLLERFDEISDDEEDFTTLDDFKDE